MLTIPGRPVAWAVSALVLALAGGFIGGLADRHASAAQPTENRECELYWLEQYLRERRTALWHARSVPPALLRGLYAHNESVRAWSYWRKCSGDPVGAAEMIAVYNDNRILLAEHFGRYSLWGRSLRDNDRDPTWCANCWIPKSMSELLSRTDAIVVRGFVVAAAPEPCDLYADLCAGDVFTTVAVRDVWRGALRDADADRIIVVHSDVAARDLRPWLQPAEEVILILDLSTVRYDPPTEYATYRIAGDRYGYFLLEGDRLRHGVLQDPADPAHRGHPNLRHPLTVFAESADVSNLEAAFADDN